MKQVYRFDKEGYFVEPVIITPDEKGRYEIPKDCTYIPLPEPNWKPIFKNGKWVESISQEELDEIQKPKERSFTDTEILGQQMTDLELRLIELGAKIRV